MDTCFGETADHIFSNSSKKTERDEGLNTLACLRGRLLAERQASREAKEVAESMGNKLVDLEKLVKEEMKLRDKAERKLKYLKKKLESFNKSRQLDHSDSSEKFENSCGSSSITSISKYSETSETETKHAAKISALTEDVFHNHKTSSSSTKDCDSEVTDSSNSKLDSQILSENPVPRYETENLKNEESRNSNLSTKSSVTDNESDGADSFDNSMALVHVNVNMTATSQSISDQKPVNESVFEALDALRLAKERIKSSLRTSQMIHVGL